MRIVEKQINQGPRIPLIIPVRNINDTVTARCLDHLERHTGLSLTVYLIESSGNGFSYGRSVNAGIKAAGDVPFFFIMDSDAFPKTGALEKMVQYAEANPRIGYIGAKGITPDGIVNAGWFYRGPIGWFLTCIRLEAPFYFVRRLMIGNTHFLIDSGAKQKPGKMIGVTSSTLLVRKPCYDDIGPFDEGYRVSYVDVDYALRVLLSDKWFISCCYDAEVVHLIQCNSGPDKRVEFEDFDHFINIWSKMRMRAVKRCAREGKFIIKGN